MTVERTGQCLCGAVRYRAHGIDDGSVCNCSMCRRWTGGPFLSVSCTQLEFDDETAVQTRQTSAWAERGFCRECGSSLFYRVTADGAHHGMTSIAFGSLDDQTGINLTREWYVDLRPEAYALTGERECFSSAQIAEMFGVS